MAKWPHRYDVVPLDRLFVDEGYQRELTSLADTIGEEFDPTLVGTLTTSQRKTRATSDLAIIDGQTRWAGASKAGEEVLPVVILEGLTRAQEARIFADIQVRRRNLSSFQRFNAQVVAKDPVRMQIQKITEEAGFAIGKPNKGGNDGSTTISAVAALERVWAWGAQARVRDLAGGDADGGTAALQNVLYVIREGFPAQPANYNAGDIIRGVGAFLTHDYGIARGVDMDRLIRKLQTVTPGMLRNRANALREGIGAAGSSSKYMAEAIKNTYMEKG